MASSRGSVNLLTFNQGSKYLTINNAIEHITAIAAGGVESYLQTSPPGSPAEGETHVVGIGAVGDWAGQDNNIAHYVNGFWEFYPAFRGLYTLNIATGGFVYYNGTSWANTI